MNDIDVFARNNYYSCFHSVVRNNVLNALAVSTLCHYENIDESIVKEGLKTFHGVKRRFTEKIVGSQVLVDDYAHHPTEITATLNAARKKYPDKTIVAIFQPHTFTRTQTFLNEFAESLQEADHVFLCDIFGSARENYGKLSIEDLQKDSGAEILQEGNISQLASFHDSVLLFMGAGDIQKYQTAYENYLQNIKKKLSE